jgi:two-component system nitrate/nitrite response regulator NarP
MSSADDGLADLRGLRERLGDIPIVAVLSGRLRPARLRKVLRTGADGIVLERDVDRALAAVVDVVLLGQVVAPKELNATVVGEALTFRERQILGLVVLGFTNRQIADKLYLAESTVKTHLSSAFAKLGVKSRAEATALILDPEEGVGLGILGVSPEDRISVA